MTRNECLAEQGPRPANGQAGDRVVAHHVTQNPRPADGLEITQQDPRYPEGLYRVEQPPARVYVRGECAALTAPALAIVGARKATPYGLSCARRFARIAAVRGIVVVSGGAIGCDQAAHGGALEIGGRTVVVLGCGADVVYPARAAAIFSQALAEGGAIISEAPWGSSPSRWGFRRRNRLIAGIAQATLIVEAGLPSGTFSTADAALAQGKEVLAVPGSIFARESRGANRLISQGAVPIVDDESFEDVLTQIFGPVPYSCAPFLSAGASVTDAASSAPVALRDDAREGASTASPGSAPGGASPGSAPGGTAPVASTPAQDSVQVKALEALAQHPLRPEELLGVCGDDVVEVIRCLTSLELTGCVTRLRDGRYANGF